MGQSWRSNSTMAAEFKKAATSSTTSKRPLFRTNENDPSKHAARHEGFFYTVPPAEFERWMPRAMMLRHFRVIKSFGEASIMVRAPAVEIIEALRATDFSAPSVRYVLFGLRGSGKSMSMAHVMHYAGLQGWYVAHEPWPPFHNRYVRDNHQPSTFKPGRIDLPLDSADWLGYFRKMNEPLLTKPDAVPKTVGHYVWSKREVTEVDTPLVEMIDFGIARAKYAPDVMGAVLKELRLQASAGNMRVLAAIDGVNGFWSSTVIKREEERSKRYHPTELSINHHWLQLLGNDWNGGATVCTVDGQASFPVDPSRYLPLELLGEEAFKMLDPFLPIHVPVYNGREVFSCIEYYRDRRWIQCAFGGTEDGRKEIISLSGCNPLELYRVCRHW